MLCLTLEAHDWYLWEVLENMTFRSGPSVPAALLTKWGCYGADLGHEPYIIPSCPVTMAERSRGFQNLGLEVKCQMGVLQLDINN